MELYSKIAQAFIDERKQLLKLPKIIDKYYFVIVDKNNVMRTSASSTILDENDSIYHFVCLEIRWPNGKGFYDYSTIDTYTIDKNGDIQLGITIDEWKLSIVPNNPSAHNSNYPDFGFYFHELNNYPSTLSHLWQTFLKLKECKNIDTLLAFKELYTTTNDKEGLIKELANKNIENQILKEKVESYQKLLEQLKEIIK